MCCSPCCKAIAGSSGRRSLPFTTNSKGTLIAVRLRPGAAANRIDGVQDRVDGSRCLVVRVTAAPEKGKANQAMIKLLAKTWHVPRGNLSVITGAKDRNKTLLLQGEPDAQMRILNLWRQEYAPE